VSYYSQQMFAHYRGTETLPVATVGGSFNPLWWVATIDDDKNEMYFKVVNSGNSSIPLTINLDAPYSAVNGTILVSVCAEPGLEHCFQNLIISKLTLTISRLRRI
jgi:alpha-L-arabinofuranosidase